MTISLASWDTHAAATLIVSSDIHIYRWNVISLRSMGHCTRVHVAGLLRHNWIRLKFFSLSIWLGNDHIIERYMYRYNHALRKRGPCSAVLLLHLWNMALAHAPSLFNTALCLSLPCPFFSLFTPRPALRSTVVLRPHCRLWQRSFFLITTLSLCSLFLFLHLCLYVYRYLRLSRRAQLLVFGPTASQHRPLPQAYCQAPRPPRTKRGRSPSRFPLLYNLLPCFITYLFLFIHFVY